MKSNLKKIICFFIILVFGIAIGNINSYAFSDKVTFNEGNGIATGDLYAPFTKGAFGNKVVFCREHNKHMYGFGNITFESTGDQNLKEGTAYLFQKIKQAKIVVNDKEVNVDSNKKQQATIWYLNRPNMSKKHSYPKEEKDDDEQYIYKNFNLLSSSTVLFGHGENDQNEEGADAVNNKIAEIINKVVDKDGNKNKDFSFSQKISNEELDIDVSKTTSKTYEMKYDNSTYNFIKLNNIYPKIDNKNKLGTEGNLYIKVIKTEANGKKIEIEQYHAEAANKQKPGDEVVKDGLERNVTNNTNTKDPINIYIKASDVKDIKSISIRLFTKTYKYEGTYAKFVYDKKNENVNNSKDGANTIQNVIQIETETTINKAQKTVTVKLTQPRVVPIKFLYKMNRIYEGDEFKFSEPTITVNNVAVNASNRYSINMNAGNPTVINGDKLTYCIRYYSIGNDKITIDSDDVYIDKYGTGLVPILSGANAPKDKSGKLVEFEFGTNNLKIKPNKTTLNGYNGKTVAYYDIYVTFEAKFNESKVFVLKNNNTYVPTGYNIKGHVFIDAPETKNGKKTTPRNNVMDHTEKLVEGIRVELYKSDGTFVNSTYTNESGEYTFKGLRSKDISIDKVTGGIEGDINKTLSYYVRFIYNGQEYENVKYGVGGNENSSYAKEKWTDRKNFNSKFTEIYGKNYERYNNENSERYSLKNTSEEESPQKQPQVTGATNKLNVSQAEFGIYAYSENIDSSTSYKNYLNLGIFKRHFDLSLENKLESMEISINGVTQKIYSKNGGMIDGTILKDDLFIKKSDYNYVDEDDTNKELAVYLNYKLTINNESLENFTGIIKSINFWYDSRLELEDQYNSDRNIHKFSEEVGDENSKFKKCEIQLKNSNVIPKENKTVDIRLKLSRETIKNCIENPDDVLKTFETVTEISCYGSEYYGDFGNGQSGNAGKIDDDSNSGNLDIQKYVSEIRKSTDPNTVLKFFNEDDAMRSLGIRLQVDDTVRTLSGKVFEDKTTNNENKRLGDGRYTENEDRKISRVKVELLEIKEPNSNGDTTSKVLLFNGDEFETQDSATTDDKGEYSIEGYIPSANYVIRFTYGDGSTGIYNAQDYKSTIDATKENYESINTTEPLPNGEEYYWYTRSSVKNMSVAKDNDTKMKESKLENMTAIQLENYSKTAGDPRFSNTATTAKFCAPINWAGNNKSNEKDENYEIQNMNLGLAERPRSELKINKTVDHITLTTSDGRTLIDGKQGTINSTSWTTRYVQAIVDENLIYGSTLKITYKYEVENIGEVDYLSNGRVAYNRDGTIVANNTNRRYYDYGDLQGQQAKTKTYVEKIIDYVDNQLMYDENMQSNPENAEKTNKDDWHVATEEELNMLGEDAKEGAKDINTKLITENLNKELEPGETTDPIYLTVSKVLSSEDDKDKNELVYNNYVEIIQSTNTSGRRSYSIKEDKLLSDVTGERGAPIKSEEDLNKKGDYILSIPGDLNPKTLITLDYEPDSDKAQEVQIVPPFGSQRVIWTIIATISAIILAGGIYLINRKVLKARNKK